MTTATDAPAVDLPRTLSAEQAVVQIFDVLMTHGGRVATNMVPGYVFVQGQHGAPVALKVADLPRVPAS